MKDKPLTVFNLKTLSNLPSQFKRTLFESDQKVIILTCRPELDPLLRDK